jgi:hypothetical protein
MTIDAYDVARAPDAAEWLQLEESARIALVAEAHRRARASAGQRASIDTTQSMRWRAS